MQLRAPNRSPAPSSPSPWKVSLASHLRQIAFVDRVAELGDAAVELQPHLAGRAVALLGDDHFGQAVNPAHVLLPLLIGFDDLDIVVVLGGLGLARGDIIILAIDEEYDVGVLLDRAGFPEVGKLRALVLALLDGAAELRQADHRDV